MRIIPYLSNLMAGGGLEPFLLHPYRLYLTMRRIHSTSACTWIRCVVPRILSDIVLITVPQAPLTISVNSPLELVQQFFVKLGARYVVVTDANGYCELFLFPSIGGDKPHLEQFADEGVIDKNGWLAFLGELETKAA